MGRIINGGLVDVGFVVGWLHGNETCGARNYLVSASSRHRTKQIFDYIESRGHDITLIRLVLQKYPCSLAIESNEFQVAIE